MKTKAILSIFLIGLNYDQVVLGQGFFQNLDFESANVSGYAPRSPVPISAALPGWSVTSPGYVYVTYDGASLGGAAVSVCDANFYAYGSASPVLDGNFSAFLFGGRDSSTTISQTGLVPSNSRSLEMLVGSGWPNLYFSVSLGGQAIQMIPMESFSDCKLYCGDISSLAGEVETLSLTALAIPPLPNITPPSWFQVDDIMFSPQPVPEPTATNWALFFGLLPASRFVVRCVHKSQ